MTNSACAGGVSELRFTTPARRDLNEIWEYIAQDNPVAAGDFIEKITETCRTIADMPYMGRDRPDLIKGVRAFSVDRYLIIYRILGNGIQIVRVAHAARNISSLLDG